MDISYLYSIRITESIIDVDAALELIEEETLAAVAGDLVVCKDYSSRRGLNSVVGVSALPEDKSIGSCGDGCTDVDGGMAIFVADEGNSDMTELQCRVLKIIQNTMGEVESDGNGIDEIEVTDSNGFECDDDPAGGILPTAGVVASQSAVAGDFPVAGVAAAAAVGAVLLALLAFFILRRRKSDDDNDKALTDISSHEGKSSEAFGRGYKDGYDSRLQAFKNSSKAKYGEPPSSSEFGDDGINGKSPSNSGEHDGANSEPLSRAELEDKAFMLGYTEEDGSLDTYCNGFSDGQRSASSTSDVHRCQSSSCEQCRGFAEPKFLFLPRDYLPNFSSLRNHPSSETANLKQVQLDEDASFQDEI